MIGASIGQTLPVDAAVISQSPLTSEQPYQDSGEIFLYNMNLSPTPTKTTPLPPQSSSGPTSRGKDIVRAQPSASESSASDVASTTASPPSSRANSDDDQVTAFLSVLLKRFPNAATALGVSSSQTQNVGNDNNTTTAPRAAPPAPPPQPEPPDPPNPSRAGILAEKAQRITEEIAAINALPADVLLAAGLQRTPPATVPSAHASFDDDITGRTSASQSTQPAAIDIARKLQFENPTRPLPAALVLFPSSRSTEHPYVKEIFGTTYPATRDVAKTCQLAADRLPDSCKFHRKALIVSLAEARDDRERRTALEAADWALEFTNHVITTSVSPDVAEQLVISALSEKARTTWYEPWLGRQREIAGNGRSRGAILKIWTVTRALIETTLGEREIEITDIVPQGRSEDLRSYTRRMHRLAIVYDVSHGQNPLSCRPVHVEQKFKRAFINNLDVSLGRACQTIAARMIEDQNYSLDHVITAVTSVDDGERFRRDRVTIESLYDEPALAPKSKKANHSALSASAGTADTIMVASVAPVPQAAKSASQSAAKGPGKATYSGNQPSTQAAVGTPSTLSVAAVPIDRQLLIQNNCIVVREPKYYTNLTPEFLSNPSNVECVNFLIRRVNQAPRKTGCSFCDAPSHASRACPAFTWLNQQKSMKVVYDARRDREEQANQQRAAAEAAQTPSSQGK
jgi:hypothetical protein